MPLMAGFTVQALVKIQHQLEYALIFSSSLFKILTELCDNERKNMYKIYLRITIDVIPVLQHMVFISCQIFNTICGTTL